MFVFHSVDMSYCAFLFAYFDTPCISRINHVWLWCCILLKYYHAELTGVPLKILAFVFLLHVSFFAVSFPYLHTKVTLVLKKEFEIILIPCPSYRRF